MLYCGFLILWFFDDFGGVHSRPYHNSYCGFLMTLVACTAGLITCDVISGQGWHARVHVSGVPSTSAHVKK